MTSKCGKNKKVAHEAIAECVTDVLTTFWRPLWSIYWTDARQHGIYLFYTIKKQTTTAFLFQNSKADLCPLRRTRKKPFDVICCQNENEAISLVAMRSKRIVIGPGKSRHRQLDLNGFPWNENLQRKQNWTAKSTNLKENLKIKVVLSSEQSCEPKSLDDTEFWKEYAWKTRGCSQHWTPFDSNFEWKERLVTVEICVRLQKSEVIEHWELRIIEHLVNNSYIFITPLCNRPSGTRPSGLFSPTQWKFSLPSTQRIFWFYPAIFMLPQWLCSENWKPQRIFENE